MRRIFNNAISILYSLIRLLILKVISFNRISFSFIERFSPNVVIELDKGKMKFGKKVRIHSGCKLKTRKNAVIEIGDNVSINYNCIFVSHEKILIGEGTEIGPNVLIYDHDHDFRNGGLKNKKYKTSPVVIGKNVWIGANVVILRGSTIGDNSVIAAGSVINGNISSNTILYQKRENYTRKVAEKDD